MFFAKNFSKFVAFSQTVSEQRVHSVFFAPVPMKRHKMCYSDQEIVLKTKISSFLNLTRAHFMNLTILAKGQR